RDGLIGLEDRAGVDEDPPLTHPNLHNMGSPICTDWRSHIMERTRTFRASPPTISLERRCVKLAMQAPLRGACIASLTSTTYEMEVALHISTVRPVPDGSVVGPRFGELIERARAFDQLAWDALYRFAFPQVYRYVASRIASVQESEDVTEE